MKINFKIFSFYLAILFFSMVFCSTVIFAQEISLEEGDKNILATVNGQDITLAEFELYWDAIPEQYKMQLTKEDLLEQIILQTLLIQKADEINLREDPQVAFQIKNATEQILIQSLIEKEIIEKTSLSDDDIESYYEENKENYWKDEQVHAFDIMTETMEQAEEVRQKLEEGMDFSILAQESSIASSAAQGGDIGFISKGTLTTEIEEQLFLLNPGDISDIIPTEKGFHIFKVMEKIPAHYLALEEVEEEIKYQLLPQRQQQAFDQYLKEIEEQAIIEKNLELLKESNNSSE
ncbi:MAG: peptidyl-prolyl cis-trans isomerase [Atribacterota bacterium]|nr:peptidyl-prolyl cis-trans isomerase [Atribacterota bacterium]MDD5497364.1 peptidyl-prolyl cis-trans isomerase [Atribacterota bacterium]